MADLVGGADEQWRQLLDDKAAASASGPKLVHVDMSDSPKLTDAGLKTLHTHGSLKYVLLNRCPKLTRPAAEALHKALPLCTIESDFGKFEPTADIDRRAAETR